MKKIIALLLALVLAFGMVACNNTSDQPGGTVSGEVPEFEGIPATINCAPEWDGSLPLVQEGEDNVVTIGIRSNANVIDLDTNKYTLWLEEQTGVDIQFVMFNTSSGDAAQQVAMKAAANEPLPDILFGFSGITKTSAREYIEGEYFIDLAPYFATNAFYTRQALDMYYTEEPQKTTMEKFIIDTISDPISGTIVGFPTVYNNPSDATSSHIWINQEWLDTLNLEAPTNIDELYEVLVAFRDQDPNGNGKKDEIPMLGLANNDQYNILGYIANAFTYEYDKYKFTVENDVVSAPYHTDEYREAIKYTSKLVKEGLLNETAWTANKTEIMSLINPGEGDVFRLGIVAAPGDVAFEQEHRSMFTYVPLAPLADATGKGGWAPMTCDRVYYTNYITADCKNPTLAFRLLDFMSCPDSYLRQRWGEYGVDWKYVDEGNSKTGMLGGEARIEVINASVFSEANNQCWHSERSIASENYWQYALDLNDGSWKAQLYKNLQTIVKYYNEGKQPEQVQYNVVRTEENSDRYSEANSGIVELYAKARAEFATGVRNPENDADWASYIKDLEGLGYYEDWIAVAQESWDTHK